MNLLLRRLLWTPADVRERDHDGLAVWGSGVRVPSAPLTSTCAHLLTEATAVGGFALLRPRLAAVLPVLPAFETRAAVRVVIVNRRL